MNYTYLKLGDQLPTVAVLQKLLKMHGAQLVCDGIFGDNTKWALREFQVRHGLLDHGRTDELTWTHLTRRRVLRILDYLSTEDSSIRETEVVDLQLTASQEDVILTGGQSGTASVLANRIMQHVAGRLGTVFLLRLHGHGEPGFQEVSSGNFVPGYESETDLQSVLWPQFMDDALHIGSLERTWWSWQNLGSIFNPYGSIQLMGCNVGFGTRHMITDGRLFLRTLSRIVGVPVSAGIEVQYAGENETFSLEGSVRNAFPGGMSLRSWARNLPDFECYSN